MFCRFSGLQQLQASHSNLFGDRKQLVTRQREWQRLRFSRDGEDHVGGPTGRKGARDFLGSAGRSELEDCWAVNFGGWIMELREFQELYFRWWMFGGVSQVGFWDCLNLRIWDSWRSRNRPSLNVGYRRTLGATDLGVKHFGDLISRIRDCGAWVFIARIAGFGDFTN